MPGEKEAKADLTPSHPKNVNIVVFSKRVPEGPQGDMRLGLYSSVQNHRASLLDITGSCRLSSVSTTRTLRDIIFGKLNSSLSGFFAGKNQVLENHKNMGARPTMVLEHHENMGARLTMYQLLSGSRIPIKVQNCIGFPHFQQKPTTKFCDPRTDRTFSWKLSTPNHNVSTSDVTHCKKYTFLQP